MKVRSGFVSNSSSSSFIITGENISKAKNLINNIGYYDYYELDGKLYTSFIGDCSEWYGEFSELSDDSIEGSHGCPYNEDDFKELEGDRGFESVYIQKDIIITSNLTKLKNELLSLDNKTVNDIIYKYRRVFNEDS